MRRTCVLACALSLLLAGGCAAQDVTVSVDRSVRHQTILGWGKTCPWAPAPPLAAEIVLERSVEELGLTRLRYEPPSGNRPGWRAWEWANDNDDPRVIHWDALELHALDQRARDWIVPFKQAVEARGEPFSIYVSPSFFDGGSSGSVPPWYLADPEEYAEFAESVLLRLRDEHGVVADYYSICNEAGNNNAFTPPVVAAVMRATVPRLRERGFPTMIQFPESVNVNVAMNYIERLRGEADLWPHIGLISYHLYGATDRLAELRQFAHQRGLPTAQTEFMNLTIDHLYNDLTVGGVSYWEIYGLGSPDYEDLDRGISGDSFRGGDRWWQFRQVLHYVRPGAVRVEAASGDPSVRVLSFDDEGAVTVVLINTARPPVDRQVTVTGLQPGLYGISRTVGNGPYAEGRAAQVGADGVWTLTAVGNSIYTIYPRQPANLPPTITAWRARPRFLHAPGDAVTLSCTATDPDGDALSATWRVVSQPEGAAVGIDQPNQSSTRASGLSAPGEYVFAVTVSDGTYDVARRLMVPLYAGNQPPSLVDVHNRIPVRVTVRNAKTLLRGGARDIEGDALSFRWSVVSQPQGAQVALESPTGQKCQATGMGVPGNYVFRFEATDGAHTVAEDLTVPVTP